MLLSALSSTAAVSSPSSVVHLVPQSPVPGARAILPATNILLRSTEPISASCVASAGLFTARGSRSGDHRCTASLCADARTVRLTPGGAFLPGEEVTLLPVRHLGADTGMVLEFAGSSFSIADRRSLAARAATPAALAQERGLALEVPRRTVGDGVLSAAADTLPADFPQFHASLFGETAPGQIFLANLVFDDPVTPRYLMILENSGAPDFYRKLPGIATDFTMQRNGRLTYFDNAAGAFYALDSAYAIVDSFRCGNGYRTDVHDLILTADGHALLMSYDPQIVDMRGIVPGGNPSALVTGLVLQEIDSAKNVVFQWRSWDHFEITDCIGINLLDSLIDYVHGNAIDVDTDGNILLSSRHLSEVTKIDRVTGDIIWRLGGKHNEFAFIGDSLGFSYQHAVRRIDGGDITLFDNGNLRAPQFSRTVEYHLDEVTKTATLVWQYRHTPDVFGFALGSVQRLPNGNTLIGWGAASPALTEVRPDGSVAYELTMPPGMFSYRAYRFPWIASPLAIGQGLPPPSVRLFQNYPNPFNPVTTIRYELTEAGEVKLTVCDLLGEEVRTLIDEREPAGEHSVQFDATGLPSGTYFSTLRVGTRRAVRKLLLLK